VNEWLILFQKTDLLRKCDIIAWVQNKDLVKYGGKKASAMVKTQEDLACGKDSIGKES
jgi:hypothetical protein